MVCDSVEKTLSYLKPACYHLQVNTHSIDIDYSDSEEDVRVMIKL